MSSDCPESSFEKVGIHSKMKQTAPTLTVQRPLMNRRRAYFICLWAIVVFTIGNNGYPKSRTEGGGKTVKAKTTQEASSQGITNTALSIQPSISMGLYWLISCSLRKGEK